MKSSYRKNNLNVRTDLGLSKNVWKQEYLSYILCILDD